MNGFPCESMPPKSSSVLPRHGPRSIEPQALQRDGTATAVSRTFGLPPPGVDDGRLHDAHVLRHDGPAGVQRAILRAQQRLLSEVVETWVGRAVWF
ncbi:hypothetical protein [Planctellipticum variicoloris]|uniref:hypothetical protein n=1 Tax=Planctellipticum variicoloris TaxID=3064265 RepID=UPI0030137517|nr:hypothetical protein SH412_000148 [Planctomycetaceae bacterium SH412]